jgi:hypothetical protein
LIPFVLDLIGIESYGWLRKDDSRVGKCYHQVGKVLEPAEGEVKDFEMLVLDAGIDQAN